MTDTEKKIAEIREALEKIDRGDLFEIAMAHEKSGEWLQFLLDELERLEREYAEERAAHNAHVAELCELEQETRKLRERLKEEIVWQDECLKLEEQLQSAHQEIERLREENEGRKKIIEAYMRIEHDLAEDAERYLQQRDKLIEVLRWYGDRETYEGNVEWDDGNIIRAEWPPINVDNGQRARDILREIGVTVE